MSLTNRRNETRIPISIPIRFRPIADLQASEQVGESENLSQRGAFMWTTYPLQVGTQIEMFMRMPHEISGAPAAEVRCTARVVRVQPPTLLSKTGVGLRIERYRVLAERERWAS